MKKHLNINEVLYLLSSKLKHYTIINNGVTRKESNEIVLTNDEKLYEVLSSLEIFYPCFSTMSDIQEEHLTQKKKDLLISQKNENDIKELFKIIDLYIASNDQIKNFSCDGDVCYLLEHNNILYQLSHNLIENKIKKLSELTIDKDNELKNVIRFDDLNTFYNKFKKIKIRKREKKD